MPEPTLQVPLRLLGAVHRCREASAGWAGVAFRSCSPRYARGGDLLSGEGSRRWGGRWNPPGRFAAVYAALDAETALGESLAMVRYYGLPEHRAMPRVFVGLEIRLGVVLDLGDGAVRRRLGVSQQRMVEEDWRAGFGTERLGVTQLVGWAAYAAGFGGMLVPSAARAGGVNIVVFPANLGPGSMLRVAEG